jgi:hypothetical protein
MAKSYTSPCETLATASSRSNSKVLATRVVLAHPRAAFHPCTCGLRRGAAAVAVVLIGYDDVKVATRTTTRRRLYSDTRLHWIAISTLLPLLNESSSNDP